MLRTGEIEPEFYWGPRVVQEDEDEDLMQIFDDDEEQGSDGENHSRESDASEEDGEQSDGAGKGELRIASFEEGGIFLVWYLVFRTGTTMSSDLVFRIVDNSTYYNHVGLGRSGLAVQT